MVSESVEIWDESPKVENGVPTSVGKEMPGKLRDVTTGCDGVANSKQKGGECGGVLGDEAELVLEA